MLPLVGLPAFYESFLYLVFHWVALATSWSLLSGYAGYFSFGHGAFFGAGMYTVATLTAGPGGPVLAAPPLAAGAGSPLRGRPAARRLPGQAPPRAPFCRPRATA